MKSPSNTSRLSLGLFVAIGKRARIPVERGLALASLVPRTPFLDPTLFSWTEALERRWPEVRSELDAVLDGPHAIPSLQDISVRQTTLTSDDRWKAFFFFGYGFRSERNCALCPVTAQLLSDIPGMRTAFFSILGPGKTLPLHRGPYKGVLRYHLALLVPGPVETCGIRVGEEVRHWKEGQSLIFDDTYMHTAWNASEEDRVVLFVDVERPLRSPVSQLNRLVLRLIAASPYVQDAKRRHEAWEKRATPEPKAAHSS
jgi:beta-hydroxylase